ncbi:transporter substrate-binding domain-containing protein [Vibrio sp. JC009]|uniref:substrate-binding periplasmic protein n=1 Tax=Vibrio sp. JC009 TaxID=2912314 RepID=UPI0023AF139D|nr:transporter substrate-binding domain-containing protein [Vibrio sp. JC009]WED22563.1 transporter substrate-binding domain-containing protein [Vibrio sp. JC009]
MSYKELTELSGKNLIVADIKRLQLLIIFVTVCLCAPLIHAKEKTDFTFAAIENFEPYSYLDEQGNPAGIYIDIMDLLFADSGFTYTANIMPFGRAIKFAMSHKVDGIIGIYDTPDRRKQFYYVDSVPLTKFQVTLFARQDSQINTSAVKEIKGKTIGKKRGFLNSPAYDKALAMHEFQVHEVETLEQLTSMLLFNRIDAFVFTSNQTYPFLRNNGMEHRIKMLSPPLKVGITYLAISRTLENMPNDFISFLSDKMSTLEAEGTIKIIHNKYKTDL